MRILPLRRRSQQEGSRRPGGTSSRTPGRGGPAIPNGLTEVARCAMQARPPPDLATSYLRTFCYAWTTTARFMKCVVPCHLCGAAEADRQAHYLSCRCFRLWLQRRTGWRAQPADEDMHEWLLRRVGMADPMGVMPPVAIDAALNAFDAERGGSQASGPSLIDARVKEACRLHRRARDATDGASGAARPRSCGCLGRARGEPTSRGWQNVGSLQSLLALV